MKKVTNNWNYARERNALQTQIFALEKFVPQLSKYIHDKILLGFVHRDAYL